MRRNETCDRCGEAVQAASGYGHWEHASDGTGTCDGERVTVANHYRPAGAPSTHFHSGGLWSLYTYVTTEDHRTVQVGPFSRPQAAGVFANKVHALPGWRVGPYSRQSVVEPTSPAEFEEKYA